MRRWIAAGLLGLLVAPFAHADAPPFDRPGIAFTPAVLPAGAFDWEQGLPDLQRDTAGGIRETVFTADTTFRLGIGSGFELQVGVAPWNRRDVRAGGVTTQMRGAGDTHLSLKWAPPLRDARWSIGFLSSVTAATGSPGFGNDGTVLSLGATLARDLGNGCAVAGYANVDRSGGVDTLTTSANLGFPIAGPIAGFVEVGHVSGGGESASVAGGGITWLLRDRVQFDVSARRGLDAHSPDLQGGIGVSIAWP